MKNFILNAKGEQVLASSFMEWARWFEHAGKARIYAQETIGDHWVSTVFLGIPGQVWETMIRHKDGEWVYQKRCETKEEVPAMHEEAMAWAREHEALRGV